MKKTLCLLITIIFFSCNKNTTYEVTGVIKEIHIDKSKLLIDHDVIPGFMEKMVMFFKIHKSVDMTKFNLDDSVKFDLVITEKSHYSLNFNIIGKSSNVTEDDFLINEDEIYREYKVGEKLNDVNFTDTNNELFNLKNNTKDKFTLISYIFSRCPMPDMCPAIISHNQYLAEIYPDINFIILSFDYLFDTPKELSDRYGSIEKKYSNIHFLSSTNHYNDLMLLTKQSNLRFWGVEEDNIGHTMRTLLIDNDLKILKIYDGLDWKPGEVKIDIKNLQSVY